jgi:hypothetical protein
MSTGSTPGHSARICQSSSAIRTGLKITLALAIRFYGIEFYALSISLTKNQFITPAENRIL